MEKSGSQNIFPILAPQVNVNDGEVKIVEWLVEHGVPVNEGDKICEIETTKSVVDVNAEHSGILYHIMSADDIAAVGDRIGMIGDTLESIEQDLAKQDNSPEEKQPMRVTPKAQKLALKHGVSLEDILKAGVKGAIKESDVVHYLKKHAIEKDALLPTALLALVEDKGETSDFNGYMARNLRSASDNGLFTTIEAQLDLTAVKDQIQQHKSKGKIITLFHILMAALGKTLSDFALFKNFQVNQHVFEYQSIDVAFIVKTFDDKIYSPVLRRVDTLGIDDIAKACQTLTLEANRQQLKSEHSGGACFTVSYIPNNVITRFVALPDRYQSAILSISGEHDVLKKVDNEIVNVPCTSLTLTYDHTILDGWHAAQFLTRLIEHTASNYGS